MAIDKINPSDVVHAYGGKGHKQKQGAFSSKNHEEAGSETSYEHFEEGDETSFMGVPLEELSPAVTAALSRLVAQIDHLQEELRHIHALEQKLSASVDHHLDLPVLTRHALLREVQVMAHQAQRNSTSAVFAYFQISNLAQIKKQKGLLAGEAVLREAAQLIKGQLRQTDKIGTLGGDGFGIVLPLSTVEDANVKLAQLVQRVENGPLMFEGHVFSVVCSYGLHSLHLTEETEDILHSVDMDLRQRT